MGNAMTGVVLCLSQAFLVFITCGVALRGMGLDQCPPPRYHAASTLGCICWDMLMAIVMVGEGISVYPPPFPLPNH
jgi:hypothetical protein